MDAVDDAFARDVGATVIADGVERSEALAVFGDAGVSLAQGWQRGRPGPPSTIATFSPTVKIEAVTRATGVTDDDGQCRRALAASRNQTEAAVAVCEHLHRFDQLMPSVYVERDGLLRCLAQRGYWQILDGLPSGVGVLTGVMRSGERIVLHDVASSNEFLEAAPGIAAEMAVPLWVGDRVVGGLNVESLIPLTAEIEAEIDRCAALLGARLAEVGVGYSDSPLTRLARSSKQLAGLAELDEVREAIVRMACEVSGMESALLAQRNAAGELEIVETLGPLAAAFRAIPPEDVTRLAAMVDRVSSCYTAGDLTGRPVAGTETLRGAGAVEVAVLPLISLGRRTGILAVAHGSAMYLSTDEIEPLELLAAEAARCLDLATTVAELRCRASSDPLTELGNHSAFHEALRDERLPYAVAIMDIDHFKSVNDSAGHLTGDRLLREVAGVMRDSLRGFGHAYRIGGDEFAAILPGVELQNAELACRRLCRAASLVLEPYGASISVGITVPSPGELPHEFVERADRLLYAAKRAGRGRVQTA